MSPQGMVLANLCSPLSSTSAPHQNPHATKETCLSAVTKTTGTGSSIHADHKHHAPRATLRFQPSFLTGLQVSCPQQSHLTKYDLWLTLLTWVIWITPAYTRVMNPTLSVPEPLMLLLIVYLAWSPELD